MRKRKWPKVLWISLTILLLLGIGGYLAMDMAVDYTLKQVAGGVDLEELMSELEAGVSEGVIIEGDGQNEIGGSDDAGAPADVVDQSEDAVAPEVVSGDAGSGAEETTEPGNASIVGESDKPSKGGDVSAAVAQEAQAGVTASEKMVVASVLLKRFSVDELKQFVAIAKDGITTEEKREARGIFLERLTEEEYNELIAIAAKHGLSQGRSYDQVKKE
jgi:hypothetical protein